MLHDAPQPLRQPPVRKCGVGNHCGVRHRQAQKHIVMPRRTHIAMQQAVNGPLQSASRALPPRELPKEALRQPCRPHRVGKIQGSNHPQAANYDQYFISYFFSFQQIYRSLNSNNRYTRNHHNFHILSPSFDNRIVYCLYRSLYPHPIPKYSHHRYLLLH